METTEPAAADLVQDLMTRLKPLAVAYNRAVLTGVLVGLLIAFASIAGAVVLVGGSRGLALVLLGFALLLVGRSVQLHRAMIPVTGAARLASAEVLAALLSAGGALPAAALEERFELDRLLPALEVLGRLEVVYVAPAAEGAADDTVTVDRARLPAAASAA